MGPRPRGQEPRGAALPWRRRVRFRQRVSRIGPNSSGRRGLGLGPGREGRSPGDSISGARSERSLRPGPVPRLGRREGEGPSPRSHSKPPPLRRLRPLKGAGLFYPADTKALHPPVFRPGLKGKLLGSRSPSSGHSVWVGWFNKRSDESKVGNLGALCPILPILLYCVKHTREWVLEHDSLTPEATPLVCLFIFPSIHLSLQHIY